MREWADLLWRAALVGFTVSAPFGPVGVLCVRGTLTGGLRAGMAVGLGASTADVIFAAIAAFGLTAIADLLVPWQPQLRIVAAIVLAGLGVQAIRHRGADGRFAPVPAKVGRAYLSSFVLLITNPIAILIFGSVFAGFGLTGRAGTVWPAVVIVLGVFVGTQVWWLGLSVASAGLRERITPRVVRGINIGSGVVLLLLAAAVLVN